MWDSSPLHLQNKCRFPNVSHVKICAFEAEWAYYTRRCTEPSLRECNKRVGVSIRSAYIRTLTQSVSECRHWSVTTYSLRDFEVLATPYHSIWLGIGSRVHKIIAVIHSENEDGKTGFVIYALHNNYVRKVIRFTAVFAAHSEVWKFDVQGSLIENLHDTWTANVTTILNEPGQCCSG